MLSLFNHRRAHSYCSNVSDAGNSDAVHVERGSSRSAEPWPVPRVGGVKLDSIPLRPHLHHYIYSVAGMFAVGKRHVHWILEMDSHW